MGDTQESEMNPEVSAEETPAALEPALPLLDSEGAPLEAEATNVPAVVNIEEVTLVSEVQNDTTGADFETEVKDLLLVNEAEEAQNVSQITKVEEMSNLPEEESIKEDVLEIPISEMASEYADDKYFPAEAPESEDQYPTEDQATKDVQMELDNAEHEIREEETAVKEDPANVEQEQITETKQKDEKLEKSSSRNIGKIQLAEVMYKPSARIIQDPTVPLHLRTCRDYIPGASVRGAKGGSNRQIAEMIRRDLQAYRHENERLWSPNPVCTVPMTVKSYGHKSRMKAAPEMEEWKIFEERDKDRRDHKLAVHLGYETLVGNLLYINIPGGNDINRSWQNFLSQDTMEWGFPYEKGSFERPRMKQPEPYLAHQVKEKLWKFPRSRTFQTTQEE